MTRRELDKKGLALIKSGDGTWHLIEKEYLRPVVESLRSVSGINLTHKDIGNQRVVFLTEPLKEYARKYVRFAEEKMGYHKTKTCSARKPWYRLPDIEPAEILISRRYGERFFLPLNRMGVQESDVFYGLKLKKKKLLMPFASCANSTFFMLQHALNSYQLTGAITVAKMDGHEIRKLLVLKPDKGTRRIKLALKTLSFRPIKSIFAELGLPKPERDFSNIDPKKIKLDKVMPDRLELDDAVLEALGFEDERKRKEVLLELYQGVVILIKDRLMKARSFEEIGEDNHAGS